MPASLRPARTTLLVGGARSGKSGVAQRLVTALGGPVTVFVTADAELAAATGDTELLDRIARHRADRPGGWLTVEAGADLPAALERAPDGTALVDCVTLWLSTLLPGFGPPDGGAAGGTEPGWLAGAETEVARLVAAVAARTGSTVVVSNDVGQGLVPTTATGRAFRDLHGRANQALAAVADRSVLVVAGRVVPLTDPIDVFEELS